MSAPSRSSVIATLVSRGRFAPYLAAAANDPDHALDLYEWNARLSAACMEAFHHVEIVVRNAMDRELSRYFDEADRGIPWFLLPMDGRHVARFDEDVQKVRRRLRDQGPNRETRDQIVAGADFGFWTALLHTEREELWRKALRLAFPQSSGNRKDVVQPLEALRIFRNRLAHHDSLLSVDVPFRFGQMLQVMDWVDPEAGRWLRDIEQVTAVYQARPTQALGLTEVRDTVVVGAERAWNLYRLVHAYVCQAGRSIRPVGHLAFYADREIKPEVPRIVRREDHVDWSEAEMLRHEASTDPDMRRLGAIVRASRDLGWTEGRYQVFDLTSPGDAGHLTLATSIPNVARGRGSAYVQGHRYASAAALRGASSTSDLN